MFFGRYPSLRVAYIDEIEETSKDKSKRTGDKVYYSALVKAVPRSVDSAEPDQKLDQVPIAGVELEHYDHLAAKISTFSCSSFLFLFSVALAFFKSVITRVYL